LLALLELAGRAADRFEKQEPREKRRLLDFVLSNSTWADGVLTPQFRQPFDLLADAAATTREEKAAGTLPDGLHQVQLTDHVWTWPEWFNRPAVQSA
jgi:hypothetical protein